MDIQNTLSGQPFAQRSGSSAASIVSERSGRSDVPLDSPAQRGERSTNLLENTELRREGDASQNSSQGSSDQADNQQREVTGEALRQAISDVESFLQVQNRDLAFSIDEDTARSVVTVIDGQSGDVIRQIPSEEVLALAERIQELQQDVGVSVGVFINNEV